MKWRDGACAVRFSCVVEALEARQLLTTYGSQFTIEPRGDSRPRGADWLPDGGYAVSWVTGIAASYSSYVRRYDASGAPVQTQSLAPFGAVPRGLDAAEDGHFVVVFERIVSMSASGTYFRIFDSSGSPTTLPISVDASAANPRIAVAEDGRFAVLYTRRSTPGLFLRRYDQFGAPVGSEVAVTSVTPSSYDGTALAIASDGTIDIGWGVSTGMRAQQWNWNGTAAGQVIEVEAASSAWDADMAIDGQDNWVLSWRSGSGDGKFRRFSASGQASAVVSVVGPVPKLDIGVSAAGDITAVWESGDLIYAQHYDSLGNTRGGQVRLSASPLAVQDPLLALSGDGEMLALWVQGTSAFGGAVNGIVYGAGLPPEAVDLSAAGVDENAAGALVGTLSTTDPDPSDTFTYTVVGSYSSLFSITGNELRTAQGLDAETMPTVDIQIQVRDSSGWVFTQPLTITVNNLNEAPASISLGGTGTVLENQLPDTVGTLLANDPEGDPVTFSLVAGEGDDDNASFAINDAKLCTSAPLDYDLKPQYSVRVRVTDTGTPAMWYERVLTINVTDLDDALPVTIAGSDGDDVIFLTGAGNGFVVNLNGEQTSYLAGHVSSLTILGESGSDSITIGSGVVAATINGGDGNDVLMGGDGADRVLGMAGLDTISGGGGNDTIDGGADADSIFGDAGNDSIGGGYGNDTIDGGVGNDTMNSGEGDDYIAGGEGADWAAGAGGLDTFYGGSGNDTAYGGASADVLRGGPGNDLFWGGAGNDTIYGGADSDTAVGELDDDSILGGDGDDLLAGSGGNDVLRGEAGIDRLLGNVGIDTLYGGAGIDSVDGGSEGDLLYGDDLMATGGDRDKVIGGDGDDTGYGGAGPDTLWGNSGNDSLLGEGGNDEIWGGGDSDSLIGAQGKDTLLGEGGDDWLYSQRDGDEDTMRGDTGADHARRDLIDKQLDAIEDSPMATSSASVAWGSYLGGDAYDGIVGVATDRWGNVYVAGFTASSGWTAGGADTTYNGGPDDGDAFVAKISANGSLAWSTYIGGSDDDVAYSLAVDGAGNVYVVGATASAGWTTKASYKGGQKDGFVVRLNANGTLAWSTCIGGIGADDVSAVTIDRAGRIYVAGATDSLGFGANGYDATPNGGSDVYVAEISVEGSLLWSSYVGGNDDDDINGMAIDKNGGIYVVGITQSAGWTAGGFDMTYGGADDGFVAKVASGGSPLWSSYIGGTDDDVAISIAIDSVGGAYVSGISKSAGWTRGGFDLSYNGGGTDYDGVLLRITSGGALAWSTYVGGANDTKFTSVAVDAAGDAYLASKTSAPAWAQGGFDTSYNGGSDVLLAKVSSAGSLLWSGYVGGTALDMATGVQFDGSGNLYLAGITGSLNWLTGGVDTSYAGNGDAFVLKIRL